MARRDGRLVLIRVIMLALAVYALGTVFTLKAQIKAKRQELDDLNIQVQTYEEANDSLREQLQNGLTDEDISELARTKLNYAEPGERVFVDTSSAEKAALPLKINGGKNSVYGFDSGSDRRRQGNRHHQVWCICSPAGEQVGHGAHL